MILIGMGVLIISIAFAILVGYLCYSLYAATKVIEGVGKTVEQLPGQLDTVFKETENILHESNQTLTDLNEKMRALSPLFYMAEDVTEATRHFSSSLVDTANSFKRKAKTGEEKIRNKGKGLRQFSSTLFRRSR